MYVRDLKEKVKEKTSIPHDEQKLIYGGKPLHDEELLVDYPRLGKNCTVHLVLSLPGGASKKPFDEAIIRELPRHLPKTKEECMICFIGPSLQMPCTPVKHPMCSTCLINFAWNEAKAKKTTINCPLCSTEWDLGVIHEYGGASDEEVQLIARCLSQNVIDSDPKIRTCPNCESYIQRRDETSPKVCCKYCKKIGKSYKDFCWFCQQPWTNGTNTKNCGNPKCNAAGILKIIEEAPMKEIIGVTCPSKRLCPQCGAAIEHRRDCKHMNCPICKTKFCFICLRIKRDGSWQCGSYNDRCVPAPKQTTVPNN